jgi:hypothetical protein
MGKSKRNQVELPKRNCVNCRNHGIKVSIISHKKECKFSECRCVRCVLADAARELSLKERNFHRKQAKLIGEKMETVEERQRIEVEIESEEGEKGTIIQPPNVESFERFLAYETEIFTEFDHRLFDLGVSDSDHETSAAQYKKD